MAHINELIDYTVTAFIVCEGKVLLIYHRQLNMWLPVGGHIELDEDPEEALFREIKEECGLEVEVLGEKPKLEIDGTKFLHSPRYLDIHRINATHRHVGMHFFARSKSSEVKLEEDEHSEIKWFSERELDDSKYNLKGDVKFYAKEALKLIENRN